MTGLRTSTLNMVWEQSTIVGNVLVVVKVPTIEFNRSYVLVYKRMFMHIVYVTTYVFLVPSVVSLVHVGMYRIHLHRNMWIIIGTHSPTLILQTMDAYVLLSIVDILPVVS